MLTEGFTKENATCLPEKAPASVRTAGTNQNLPKESIEFLKTEED